VQTALFSSLLIAALFFAPIAQPAQADEAATTTQETTTDVAASSGEEVNQEVVGTRSYTTHSDQPVFLIREAHTPYHSLQLTSSRERQKALRDGNQTYLTVMINQAPTTVSITADISALGGSTTFPLQDVYDFIDSNTGTHTIRQFQSDFIAVQTSGFSGQLEIPVTATDENGDVLTTTIPVMVDNVPPLFTITAAPRAATTSLTQGDSLFFSGVLDGTGSTAKLYRIRLQELGSDSETIISQAEYGASHTSSPEMFALRGGSFSNLPVRIFTAEATETFPEEVQFLRYIFTIDDDAGNLITATSSLISVLPGPPEPVGPRISNVLFLPGIKGSKLYKNGSECVPNSSDCDIKLWVPNGDARVRELFLSVTGQSQNDVYVKDRQIIDSAGGQKFYASFIDDMNARDASDEYGASWTWRPVAYDWRLSLPDIVNNGAKHGDNIYYNQATSTPYIEQTLRELAQTSSTGKVTIVAHSNGGLVAKALLRKLGDAETAELVDKIIFVGVPQSGAPQAIGGLLFGYAEGLPGKAFIPDFIMTKSTARELAENSPMAYHLLPSHAYLRGTQDPEHAVISFTGSHLYQEEQNRYGPTVDTIEELYDFLLARDGGRSKPAYSDLTVANVLNAGLITYANVQHDAIDSWKPPAGVTLYQIAGWGADTVSGVDFYDERKILGVTVGYKRQYRPIFVEDGDGVVPVPSALMTGAASNVKSYWLNLKATSEQLRIDYDHGTLFEAASLREFIDNKLQSVENLSQFVTSNQPAETSQSKKLIFQLHSPLTLGIYDTNGNYTGLNTDGSVSENVSGVQYGEFGDVKYLIAPAGQKYTLALRGQSAGTFSLDIQEKLGNAVTTTTTISDVPTTSQTNASLTITNGVADASSLMVDENGDGSADFEIAPTIGETTAYTTSVVETVETNSGTTSGSKPITQSSTEVKADATVVLQAPIPTTKVKAVAHSVPTFVLTQPSSVESVPDAILSPTTEENHTQTASVYDAFLPFTEWIKSLLYNLLQGTITLIRHFLP
jgi:pimeloyl-ACP methyl ester carboxylesterase